MPKKKKATKAPTAKRIDVSAYGIDLPELIEEIRTHAAGKTYEEIGEAAALPRGSVSNYFNGTAKPSLGAVAALADAVGGRIVVKFEPPAPKRAMKRRR